MRTNVNTDIKSQESRFSEYLELHSIKQDSDTQHLREAFLAECEIIFQLANKCWPEKSFTFEEAVDCVLIALKNKDSNNKVKFLPNLFVSLYDEIAENKTISDLALSVIQSDWGIVTDRGETEEFSLETAGANSIGDELL